MNGLFKNKTQKHIPTLKTWKYLHLYVTSTLFLLVILVVARGAGLVPVIAALRMLYAGPGLRSFLQ